MKLSEENKRLSVAAGAGAFVGVVLTVLAGRIFGPPGGNKTSGARPPPGPPATAGTTLTVSTPQGIPGVLRAAAARKSNRVALLPRGTQVTVVDSSATDAGRWYQVKTPDGKVGWVAAEVVS